MGGGGRQASATNAKAGSWTRLGFGMAQGGTGPGEEGGCADGGGAERGGGGMMGCVWGSRGTVRVQAEVVVLLRQG